MRLSPAPASPFVVPSYLGGPLDGGFGAVEPASGVLGSIRRHGGVYQLQGFQSSREWVVDKVYASVAPDRAVYQWEWAK